MLKNNNFATLLKRIFTHKLPSPSKHINEKNQKGSKTTPKNQYKGFQKQSKAKQTKAKWSKAKPNQTKPNRLVFIIRSPGSLFFSLSLLYFLLSRSLVPLLLSCCLLKVRFLTLEVCFVHPLLFFILPRKLPGFYLLFLVIIWPSFATCKLLYIFILITMFLKINHVCEHLLTSLHYFTFSIIIPILC